MEEEELKPLSTFESAREMDGDDSVAQPLDSSSSARLWSSRNPLDELGSLSGPGNSTRKIDGDGFAPFSSTDYDIEATDAQSSAIDEEGEEEEEDEEVYEDDYDYDLDDEESEDEIAHERLEAKIEELRYRDFDSLPIKYKISGMIEPPVLGYTDIPPRYKMLGRIYGLTIASLALLHAIAICIFVSNQIAGFILLGVSTLGMVVDIVVRAVTYAPRRSKIGLTLDVLCLIATIFFFANIFRKFAVHGTVLRALRFFRVTLLFKDYETFRDIALVHTTIVSSIRSLSVFVIIFLIGIFIFATVVWVLEQYAFDENKEIWFRPCLFNEPCLASPSPFQSIPDAMWLIMNSMTTVGLGDMVPYTTSARIFTGFAIIAGVFVIAFPTMIFVGNLYAVRKDYFKSEEKRATRLQVLALSELADQDRPSSNAVSLAASGILNLEGARSVADIIKTTQSRRRSRARSRALSLVNALQMSMFDFKRNSEGGEENGMARPGSSIAPGTGMLCGESLLDQARSLKRSELFDFMGSRKVVLDNTLTYRYVPLCGILMSEEDPSLPVVSNFTIVDGKNAFITVTMVIDDEAAQRAAGNAISEGEDAIALAARPHRLEVIMREGPSEFVLLRRTDTAELLDNRIPLVFQINDLIKYDSIETIQRDMAKVKIRALFRNTERSSSMWRQTRFLTAPMLNKTEFVQEMRAISIAVHTGVFWTKDECRKADPLEVQRRRNVAFISESMIPLMLQELFPMLAEPGAIIINRGDVEEQVTNAIKLHSREVYVDELPPVTHTAVYDFASLIPGDRVLEIDVDFLRHTLWPLGTLSVEYVLDEEVFERDLYLDGTIVDSHGSRREARAGGVPTIAAAAKEALSREYCIINEQNMAASFRGSKDEETFDAEQRRMRQTKEFNDILEDALKTGVTNDMVDQPLGQEKLSEEKEHLALQIGAIHEHKDDLYLYPPVEVRGDQPTNVSHMIRTDKKADVIIKKSENKDLIMPPPPKRRREMSFAATSFRGDRRATTPFVPKESLAEKEEKTFAQMKAVKEIKRAEEEYFEKVLNKGRRDAELQAYRRDIKRVAIEAATAHQDPASTGTLKVIRPGGDRNKKKSFFERIKDIFKPVPVEESGDKKLTFQQRQHLLAKANPYRANTMTTTTSLRRVDPMDEDL